MKDIVNPVGINNYLGPELFCDRVNETNTLIQNIQHNSNTAFLPCAEWGKTI